MDLIKEQEKIEKVNGIRLELDRILAQCSEIDYMYMLSEIFPSDINVARNMSMLTNTKNDECRNLFIDWVALCIANND